MKKFLKFVIIFISFSTLFYLVALILCALVLPSGLTKNIQYHIGGTGQMNSRIKDIQNFKNCDIVFLGSSHAYRSFDTRIFSQQHIKSFNLGSSSQTPIQTEMLLDKYLDYLNPKTIVYEVYPLTFTEDGVESALDLIANDHIDLNTFNMVLNLNHTKVYNTFLYGYFRQFFSLNDVFSEPRNINDDTYIDGGFVERKLTYYNHDSVYKSKILELNKNQKQSFERTILKLKQRGVKIILVQAPVTHNLYNSVLNNSVIDSYYLSKTPNYFNFNKLINLNDHQHFFDADHLNQNGVQFFNTSLINLLKQKELIFTK